MDDKSGFGDVLMRKKDVYREEVSRLVEQEDLKEIICPFDGKPCSGEIIFDGPACDGVWFGDADGNEKRIKKPCPRFPYSSG